VICVRFAERRQRSSAFGDSELLALDFPQGRNAEPVAARQFEQWQLNATRNSSETSYSTVWQAQRPFSMRTV